DIVLFNDGTSKNITAVPSEQVGNFIVTANTAISLQTTAGPKTLTIGGGAATDLVIDAGSRLSFNAAGPSLTLTIAHYSSAEINGDLAISNNRTFNTNGTS